MRTNRVLAVLAVMVMVSVPLFVAADEGSEGAEVETINIDDFIGKTGYWASAEKTGENAITFTYNGTGTKCIVDFNPITTKWTGPVTVTLVSSSDKFIIAEGCGIIDFPTERDYYYTFNLGTESAMTLDVRGMFRVTVQDVLDINVGSKLAINGGTVTGQMWYNNERVLNLADITSSGDPFTIGPDSAGSELPELGGSAVGVSGLSEISLFGGDVYVAINGLTLSNLIFRMHSAVIILVSDFISDVSVKFIIGTGGGHTDIYGFFSQHVKSSDVKVHSFAAAVYGGDGPESASELRDYFCASFNESGIVQEYVALMLLPQQGIKDIETGSENNIIVLDTKTPFDLTTVNVTCEDGFVFEGWYYVNDLGVECRITDYTAFSPSSSMVIYANAVQEIEPAPASNDNTSAIVVLGVFVAVLVALAIAVCRRNS